VGRLPIDQEVVEGLQAAELVRSARDRPAGQHERDARIALAGCEVALVDDCEAHGMLTPAGGLPGHLMVERCVILREMPSDARAIAPLPSVKSPLPRYTSVTTCEILESTECSHRMTGPALAGQDASPCAVASQKEKGFRVTARSAAARDSGVSMVTQRASVTKPYTAWSARSSRG